MTLSGSQVGNTETRGLASSAFMILSIIILEGGFGVVEGDF